MPSNEHNGSVDFKAVVRNNLRKAQENCRFKFLYKNLDLTSIKSKVKVFAVPCYLYLKSMLTFTKYTCYTNYFKTYNEFCVIC